MHKEMQDCTLCPRMCHADRAQGKVGFCGMDGTIRAARAALHMWEEPCIAGEKGSGAVFFTGCTLRCVFCQNHQLADGSCGKEITEERLTEIYLELQEQGAANINLVTPGHYTPQIIASLQKAREMGLRIPIVYNTSGYERVETLRTLEGIVDVWLPDFKYMDKELAKTYSRAENYPETAKKAIEEMVRQAGTCEFDAEGYIKKGVIVRHLLLPGHMRNSMDVLQYLHETYGEKIYISVMNQYTPLPQVAHMPPLHRTVTKREYKRVLDYAVDLGIAQGYFQDGKTADESFIPLFEYEGL